MKIFIISDLMKKIEENSRKRARALLEEIKGLPVDEQVEIIFRNL